MVVPFSRRTLELSEATLGPSSVERPTLMLELELALELEVWRVRGDGDDRGRDASGRRAEADLLCDMGRRSSTNNICCLNTRSSQCLTN